MTILAFDASTEAASVALFDGNNPSASREIFEIVPRAHARHLLPAAQSLLDAARLELADLNGIAFARGPGAFTGLRIAAGLVQGLAVGAQLPVVGVSTLAALAARAFEQVPNAHCVQVVQDARMGEIYTALFERAAMPDPAGAERVIAPTNLELVDSTDTIRAGNGWSLVAEVQDDVSDATSVEWPHAYDVARIAWPVFAAGQGRPAASAVPVYVRDDVARKPKQPRKDT